MQTLSDKHEWIVNEEDHHHQQNYNAAYKFAA